MTTEERKVTKCYVLTPAHIAVVADVARCHGQCSDSAALRLIIDKYAERVKQEQIDG
jgi:hypothetical protein